MVSNVTEAHPELMHYTTAVGLRGIVENSEVWATNARFLNDSQEITHYFDVRLSELVAEVVDEMLLAESTDPAAVKQIESFGGISNVRADAITKVSAVLRDRTLAYNDPFVFALSVPFDNQVRQHGLLSQWRGYGRDGGYAVVFDSKELEDFLRKEEQAFQYQHMQWGDVYYYGTNRKERAQQDVEEAEQALRRGVEKLLKRDESVNHAEIYFSLTTLTCLSKHWGFAEEQEVRVVAIPQRELSVVKNGAAVGRAPKPVEFLTRDGLLVPFLRLRGGGKKLPIKQIIVGPHKDQALRRSAAERLLSENGYDAFVTISAIPYLGR
jgi:hypothetical protein